MINITCPDLSQLQAWLSAMPDTIRTTVSTQLQSLTQSLLGTVQDKLDGGVLQSKSGRLRDSISSMVEDSGDVISGSVFVDGDVPYAAIQEYGGSTKAHVIEASNAKVLAFSWQGKDAFFKRVSHPGSVIPERSYLRSSLADMQDEILAGMEDAINTSISD
jgi:phage gpG-like protein